MGTRGSDWRVVEAAGGVEILDDHRVSRLRIVGVADRTGRVARDGECRIETPWGEHTTSTTLKKSPYRRSSATRVVTLADRRYVCRPVTDRRSVVERDGHEIAQLHKSWQCTWRGRRPSFEDLGFTMKAPPVLEPLDEAMVVAFAAVIGPPGHEGGFTTTCRLVPRTLAELFSSV